MFDLWKFYTRNINKKMGREASHLEGFSKFDLI